MRQPQSNMILRVVLREIRIYLDDIKPKELELGMKVQIDKDIFKFNNFKWNQKCKRWQSTTQIELQFEKNSCFSFQLLNLQRTSFNVIAQSHVNLAMFPQHLTHEIKNCLLMDGTVVGWLYCELTINDHEPKTQKYHYLSIEKITFHFLEIHNLVSIRILLNQLLLVEKQYHLSHRRRTVYPNLKAKVKKSDCLIFQLKTQQTAILPLSFLIDRLSSGEMSNFSVWMKNKNRIKVGQLEIQYFLDNFHFDGQLQKKKDKQLTLATTSPTTSSKTRASFIRPHRISRFRPSKFTETKQNQTGKNSLIEHSGKKREQITLLKLQSKMNKTIKFDTKQFGSCLPKINQE